MTAPTPSVTLDLGGSRRSPGPFALRSVPPLSTEAALALAPEQAHQVWLGGGEPTLRPDLPALVEALTARGHHVGLVTDGLALTPRVTGALVARGLRQLKIDLYSSRPALHDWLVGTTGAHARLRRHLASWRESRLPCVVRVPITRPGSRELEAAAALALRHAAASLEFLALVPTDFAPDRAVALTPRLSLLAPSLDAAVALTRQAGVPFRVLGIPRCVLSSTVPAEPSSGEACSSCRPGCPGLDRSYRDLFGVQELRAPRTSDLPVLDVPLSADESSRVARMRLVRAAQEEPRVLQLGPGWLEHPQASFLVRDAFYLVPHRLRLVGALDRLAALPSGFGRKGLPEEPGCEVQGVLLAPDPTAHDTRVQRPGAFANSLDVARWFLDQGADVTLRCPSNGPALAGLSVDTGSNGPADWVYSDLLGSSRVAPPARERP